MREDQETTLADDKDWQFAIKWAATVPTTGRCSLPSATVLAIDTILRSKVAVLPEASELLVLAVEHRVIPMSKVMDADLQDALLGFARALLATASSAASAPEAHRLAHTDHINTTPNPSDPQDVRDYKALCDLWQEANAIDTVIGRPEVLLEKIRRLRDDFGSRKQLAQEVPR